MTRACMRGGAVLARVLCALVLLATSAVAQATNEETRRADADDPRQPDSRTSFMTNGYVGYGIDNFAPASVGGYLNPDAAGFKWRFAGGFDFEYRATGDQGSRRQLWLFGETLHGVRTADVNCGSSNPDDKPPVCSKLSAVNPQDSLQFIVDHATSLEAYAGARYEFLTLQSNHTQARLYVTARLGVMMLAGDATVQALNLQVNRAYEAYHFGTGLIVPGGLFQGSHIETGVGRTDLFNHDGLSPWRRLKVDAYLSIPFTNDPKKSSRIPKAFVQLYADFDPTHKTSDSIQSFYGLEFDLVGMFKPNP